MGRAIGILTGTFDPVHVGHVALARAAREAGGLDEVWLLVNSDPAHKIHVLPYEQRLALVRLAVDGVLGVRLADEAVAAVPQTMAGFGALMARYPQDRFVFVVGMDVMAGLDQWEDVAAVVREAAFLVARRPGVDVQALDELRRRLGPLGTELSVRVFEFERAASSSAVRRQLRTGARPEWLDVRVYEYIVRQGWYETGLSAAV